MFLDLKDIDPEGVAFDHRPGRFGLDGPDGIECQVDGAAIGGRVAPGSRGIALRASVRARVGLACSRCLAATAFDVDDTIDLVLDLDPEAADAPGELEIEVEDTDELAIPEGRLDLDGLLREQILLQWPAKPLCSPDCRGLCPVCGADRNREECVCVVDEIDPRLAPLMRWKTERERNAE